MNKRYFMMAAVLAVFFSLSGCAKMMQHFGYEQAMKPVSNKAACESAQVLITNLKRPPWMRKYLLTDGRACPVLDPKLKKPKHKKPKIHYLLS